MHVFDEVEAEEAAGVSVLKSETMFSVLLLKIKSCIEFGVTFTFNILDCDYRTF